MVQASFFSLMAVFLPEMFTAYDVLLQIFKERTSLLFTPQLKLCEEIGNV
jgi:hypothetical protein